MHTRPLQWGTQQLLGLHMVPIWVNLVLEPYPVDLIWVFWPHDPFSAAPPTDVVIWRKESDSMYDTRVQKGFLQIHISFHCCTGFVHQVRFAFLIGWTLILEPGSIVHPQEEPPNSKLCITAFQKPLWPSVYSIWISNWIFSLGNLIWEKLGWTFSCHRDDDHHDWLGLNGQDGGRGGVPRLGQCWYLSNGPLHKRRKKRGKKKEKFLHIFFRYETRRSRDVDMLQHNALREKGNIVGGGPEQFREVGEKDLKCK